MTNKRPTDYNALAARWQREAEDWSDPDDEATSTALARRPATFVAPPAPKVEILPQWDSGGDLSRLPAPAVHHEVIVHGSYEDRARGYVRTVLPLATVAGGLAAISAVLLFGTPFLSFLWLLWFWTVFAGVWLISYAIHQATGQDGQGLFHLWRQWRYIDREQEERFARMRRWEERH